MKGVNAMKNIKIFLALAVFLLGIGFVANAFVPSNMEVFNTESGVLNINTTSVEELKMIPDIDSQTAENIVSYREFHGPFTSIDELLNVKGITRPLLEILRPHLVLEGDSDYKP
jgi:competence ComEA-like helix-hairpin-helix protein